MYKLKYHWFLNLVIIDSPGRLGKSSLVSYCGGSVL